VRRPKQRDGDAFGVKEALGHGLHLGGFHFVDAGNDLVHGEELVGTLHLLAGQVAMRAFELSRPSRCSLELVLARYSSLRECGFLELANSLDQSLPPQALAHGGPAEDQQAPVSR